MIRQDGMAVFTPAYQETPGHTILEHLRACLVQSDMQLAPSPCLLLPPEKPLSGVKREGPRHPPWHFKTLFDVAMEQGVVSHKKGAYSRSRGTRPNVLVQWHGLQPHASDCVPL